MKNFEELLRASNVKAPRSFIGRRKIEEVKFLYEELTEWVEKNRAVWATYQQTLQNHWEIEVPEYEDPEPVGKGIRDLKDKIMAATEREIDISNSTKLLDQYMQIEHDVRGKWVDQIVERAPEGTTLVVMKDSTYMPLLSNKKAFDEKVEEKLEARISTWCGLNTEWFAFSPDNYRKGELYNPEKWSMHKNTTTVQYV